VLLINGLSAPAVNWALQAKALARHFQVVVFDNRGVGETDLPPEPVYTTGQMAEDAAALLRHLKIARRPRPRRLDGWHHRPGAGAAGTPLRPFADAALHVSELTPASYTRSRHGALANRVPIEERYRYVVYPWIFCPSSSRGRRNVETAFQRSMAYPHQTKAEAIERQARGILAWNGTRASRLSGIRVPTLVMVGKDDILTPPAFSRALAKRIRGHGSSSCRAVTASSSRARTRSTERSCASSRASASK